MTLLRSQHLGLGRGGPWEKVGFHSNQNAQIETQGLRWVGMVASSLNFVKQI